MFNGTPVAFASGVDGSEEIQYQPVEVLDNLEVVEYVPVGYRVTLTCAMFRTISKGASPTETAGSIKQQNIFPSTQNILTTEGVDVLIIDRVSNKAIATFHDVKTTSYRFSITARGLVAQNVTFMSTRMTDESE
jgi:hypothetical protein